uniref:Uncharacterized protein n=1 Tax=Candidatus Kentrum sp. FM TaxID=2126340 RepID=A0A450RXY0_9GAMM|nr:MAG: hypothetical protein BECKFM1743A_GA0114220_100074 [Candidatus Kentron sp. FM]VFJ43969.1 MAG: hypothetical protein BECKFM1743C_GA0114222_1000717 [Candidatus Kentron sp. FM]VFK06016.1 MAG: hypothetical protein BECKFM1743B_GA0114221_100094 [Candidatus Kentron sp. FM]
MIYLSSLVKLAPMGLMAPFHENELDTLRRKHASEAAASAILARNMSHNIGSHVTPRTRLEDLRGRIGEFFLPKAGDPRYWGESPWRVAFDVLKELKDTLDEYEQRKAEFIAEFSTDPLISTREAWFYRDVVLPFIRNTALMDTLAANEGFHYRKADSPGITVRCFRQTPDGETVEFRPFFFPERLPAPRVESLRAREKENKGAPIIPYGLRTGGNPSVIHTWSILGIEHDVRVSLPGPVGEMALYSILENLIRNAAKHGGRRGDDNRNGPMEIRIVIREPKGGDTDNEYYALDIGENLSDPAKVVDADNERRVVDVLNGHIKDSIVDDAGQVRKQAWGLAEMGLCADLFRGQAPGDFRKGEKRLKVRPGNWEGFLDEKPENPDCLVYSLKVKRAWTAVFFGFKEVPEEERLRLRSGGFDFKRGSALFGRDAGGMPAAFRFAVLNARLVDEHGIEEIGAILNRLPFRIIVTGDVADTKEKEWLRGRGIAQAKTPLPFGNGRDHERSTGETSRWLWREWLGFLAEKTGLGDTPLALDVYFMQDKGRQPTKDWIGATETFNGEASPDGKPDKIPARVEVWERDTRDGRVKPATENRPDTKEAKRIIIDRHGDFAEKSGYRPSEKDRLIIIDKASTDFDALYNAALPDARRKPDEPGKKPDGDPWELPFELAEAGLLRVLILDERIAQNANREFDETGAAKKGFRRAVTRSENIAPRNWHIAERAGVYVAGYLDIGKPDGIESLDLAGGGWRHEQVNAPKKLGLTIRFDNPGFHISAGHWPGPDLRANDHIPRRMEDVDLVIIHQGILDRVREECGPAIRDDLLAGLEKCCWLIVESGRGIPPEVQEGKSKFLPFSLIERAFRGGRVAKLGLTRAVMAMPRNKSS